jgi:hypothetical protein
MNCENFFNLIKQYFDFLINEYGFEVVIEEIGTSFDWCILVLKSKICCVRFSRDKGDVIIEVGPISALNRINGGKKDGWFFLNTIINFFNKTYKFERSLFGNIFTKKEKKMELQIRYLSKQFEKYKEQIFELFNQGTFEKRKVELKEFSDELGSRLFEKI